MYASTAAEAPSGEGWAFEPKYDGIRVLAFATPRGAALVTRNARNKSAQFPEVVEALRALAARRRRDLVLDGEIVAMRDDAPARFQQLQSRMHVQDPSAIARHVRERPAALHVFDILVDGESILLDEPWTGRRRVLERRLRGVSGALALVESERGDPRDLFRRARAQGWEGLIAKRMDARYRPGVRSRDWLKLKLEHRQEFVVGGWTEPRRSRAHIGALLLGYYVGDRLVYAGHMGGGFSRDALESVYDRLRRLEQPRPPFENVPRSNEPAHWVRPEMVVEVRFNEWTSDGKLRQPIFLGVRDDKDAREVTREEASMQRRSGSRDSTSTPRARAAPSKASRGAKKRAPATASVESQLMRIEKDGGDGDVVFARGPVLRVSNLGKVYFPGPGFTKGDLMRYYTRVAPLLLPAIADRPLALRRFPDGVDGPSFYQQNAGDRVPPGVRTEDVVDAKGHREPRFVGGDLPTLLYTVQLGCIEVHPWFSRVQSLDQPDFAILDLDPGSDVNFADVVAVARLVKRELDDAGVIAAVKTSGSRGMHIGIALPGGFSFAEASAVTEGIARRVVERAPERATLERRIRARPRGTVYLDHQQNARGKTLASAWSVRARVGATVSMPLKWSAIRATLDPTRFTLPNVPGRASATRALWLDILSKRTTRRGLRALLD